MKKSDDQRMKDLTNRLVAMSPEPPPFPEEVTMTTPVRKPTTWKPLAVFAAAAVVVLLGFGIPFLLMNGGEPSVAGPETTTTTTTSTPTTVPVDETSTTTLVGNPSFVDTVVFLAQTPENSFLGNPAMIALAATVEVEANEGAMAGVRNSINMLGSSEFTAPEPFMNLVPSGVEALDVRPADGADNVLIIEMNEVFLSGAGGLLADFAMLNQLIHTATYLPDIDEVQFIVNNQPVTQFGSEGLDLSSSVSRESFQEHLALINLTSPVSSDTDLNIVVEGTSNTFEASLAVQVVAESGEAVHEEFGTATCGSGCWGEYMFVLNRDLFQSGSTIRILEYSAEDGEPQNVISVPYEFWFLPDALSS
ncbi:MAG: Gmad2 immunoglobulin-like domain-containing protein [Acidimicrobiia bacterium]